MTDTLTKIPEAPYNATTGDAYRGGNVARLLAAEAAGDYDHAAGWAGFHQWRAAGRQVRKGEHGTRCLTVIAGTDERGRETRSARGFVVFHYDQTEEFTDAPSDATPQRVTPAQVIARDRAARAARTEAPSAPLARVVIAETRHVDAPAPSSRTAAALAALGIK